MDDTMENLRRDYKEKTSKSQKLHQRATESLPGGDTRSVTYHTPYPTFVEQGAGYTLETEDSETLLDFLNNYTQTVLGHAPEPVMETISNRLRRGNGFGAPTEEVIQLAEQLVSRVPSIEQVRFGNSGTEATMNAIRAAMAYTDKSKILKIRGGYHGTHDTVEVGIKKSGREHGGIPREVEDRVITVPYNNVDALQQVFSSHSDQLACFIVEPILGSGGMIPATSEFLKTARELSTSTETVLIFDEVMSFRLARGGAQERYGVHPDLTTLGKLIGGGLPIGAFGGREDIMSVFHPSDGEVAHSGTFNGNPATMAGGSVTLNQLDEDAIEMLNDLGSQLREEVQTVGSESNVPIQVTGDGSLFHIHLTDGEVRDYQTSTANPANQDTPSRIEELYLAMRNRGIFMASRGMGNLSTPMEEQQVTRFVDVFETALSELEQNKR